MIQRIQSVYLLIATILLGVSTYLPVGSFIADNNHTILTFTTMGVSNGNTFYSTGGLLFILILSAIVSFASILLFKNRALQFRMCLFNIILLIGFYISFIAFVIMLQNTLKMSYHISWAACLPAVSIILIYLAIRAITKDEKMVKDSNRLR